MVTYIFQILSLTASPLITSSLPHFVGLGTYYFHFHLCSIGIFFVYLFVYIYKLVLLCYLEHKLFERIHWWYWASHKLPHLLSSIYWMSWAKSLKHIVVLARKTKGTTTTRYSLLIDGIQTNHAMDMIRFLKVHSDVCSMQTQYSASGNWCST